MGKVTAHKSLHVPTKAKVSLKKKFLRVLQSMPENSNLPDGLNETIDRILKTAPKDKKKAAKKGKKPAKKAAKKGKKAAKKGKKGGKAKVSIKAKGGKKAKKG